MKYTLDIEINNNLEKTIALFDDPKNMPKWQAGLVSFEHRSGTPGEEGAVSDLKYKMGKREISMTETIVKRNLPEEFTGFYEAKGVKNWVKNKFEKVDENTTRWISENEFQCKGLMKVMTWLMPGSFKKQSYQYMKDFKAFAESEK